MLGNEQPSPRNPVTLANPPGTSPPGRPGLFSIVITNHNYGQFVGAAIESALALDWPDVEVIVVDDGSTDDSRQVIAAYADRVRIILQDNATQRVAANVGFSASTGEMVIFLDSDDLVRPSLVQLVQRVWRPGISKVQVQLARIDALGRPIGSVFPRFHRAPSPREIRAWAAKTSSYPTPPGSGNIYSRMFLDQMFPLDDSCGDFADSVLLASAPFLGDVVTVPEPLVLYRLHGANDSNMTANDDHFPRAIARARERHLASVRHQTAREIGHSERALFRSRELLQLRVAAARLRPGNTALPGDGRARRIVDTLTSWTRPGPEGVVQRAMIVVWSLLVQVAPPPLARRLIHLRYRQPSQ